MEGVSNDEDIVVEKKTWKSLSQAKKASQASKTSSQAKGKGEGKVKK